MSATLTPTAERNRKTIGRGKVRFRIELVTLLESPRSMPACRLPSLPACMPAVTGWSPMEGRPGWGT
jgi:hypothetical protein